MEWKLSPNASSEAKEFLSSPFSSGFLDHVTHYQISHASAPAAKEDLYELLLAFSIHYNDLASLCLGTALARDVHIKENPHLRSIIFLVASSFNDENTTRMIKYWGLSGGRNMIKATMDIDTAMKRNISELQKNCTNGDAIACAKEVDAIVCKWLGYSMSAWLPTEASPYHEYIQDVELVESSGKNSDFGCEIM